MRGGNIEEYQFVGTFVAVSSTEGNRVAGILEVDEIHTLHGGPVLHVEARYYASGKHVPVILIFSRSLRVMQFS